MKALLVICLVTLARTQDVMEDNAFESDVDLSPEEIENMYEGDEVDADAPLAASSAADCDFEQGGMCKWVNVLGSDVFDWKRQRGSTPSSRTGPTKDHTKGTWNGYYLFIETSTPRRRGHNAILKSAALSGSSSPSCFEFWYHMYGATINQLEVSIKTMAGVNSVMWVLHGHQGNKWQRASVPIPASNGMFSIIIEGTAGTSYTGDIAIDDIKYSASSCTLSPPTANPPPPPPTRPPTIKPNMSPADCDFEQGGMCKWVNVRGGDIFDWTRHRGSTKSGSTGPSNDHTKGTSSGYYLYIETSSPRKIGHNAILKSPAISGSSSPSCFSFWYHMYGLTINQLKVSIKTMAGANTIMWLLKDQQGNKWQRALVPIPASNGTFSILMEGISGASFTSDISIDDLVYFQSSCQLFPLHARPPTPITPGPPTPPPITLAPGSCGISPVPHSRVIGGKDAAVGAWPWQAALLNEYGRFFCGGSLINNQWILTAAHCIRAMTGPYYYKVTLGDHNRLSNDGTEKDFTVSKVIPNPDYRKGGSSNNNDVALLKLSRPVLITSRISPVCLPTKSEVVAVGTKCYITGWGKISHPGSSHTILQQAVMPIRSKKDCVDRLAKSPYAGRLKITDQMVCAGHLGNSTIISGCHGDSGGPLVCQKPTGEFQLHGAVSWGSPKCSIQQLYTVFARITAVRDWIDRTVSQN